MKLAVLGAEREVTGSCVLLQPANMGFSLDWGMARGGSDVESSIGRIGASVCRRFGRLGDAACRWKLEPLERQHSASIALYRLQAAYSVGRRDGKLEQRFQELQQPHGVAMLRNN